VTPHDSIELNVVHSIYKTKTIYQKMEGGELFPERKEVLVKQIKVKKWFVKECISSVEEYVNSKNQISKKRSVVFDKFSGRYYATFHSPQEVIRAISTTPMNNQIGFRYDTNIHPATSQVQQHRSRRY
jgi:hypothetical protein